MDTDLLRELAPHYLAMVLLALLTVNIVRFVAGDIGFVIELVVIAAAVFAYRPFVTWIGLAPEAWERE